MEHKARKRFGQNFLHDPMVIQRLVNAINPQATDNMVEIGPGQGALTAPLLARLDQLQAVELDRDLVPFLREQHSHNGLTVHEADALKFNFNTLLSAKPLRVVGNLPYNISTPLLFHLISYHHKIQDMHFMLQLEVVDRLAAGPGSKTYGRLSVITQYYCTIDKLFNVPPGAFNPPPKVMSAIVRLVPRTQQKPALDTALFEFVVRISFAQRRKTLRNNLKQILTSEQLDSLTIDLTRRPEQLSLQEFIDLSNIIVPFDIIFNRPKDWQNDE